MLAENKKKVDVLLIYNRYSVNGYIISIDILALLLP